MNKRKTLATAFILIALVLGILFFSKIMFPIGLEGYFTTEYYTQFGPLAICVELLIAGFYLLYGHSKANFALAVFAFTALLDPLFNLTGIFTSQVPIFATLIFVGCALLALYIASSNTMGTGRISVLVVLVSFVLGAIVELFFNGIIG